LTGNASEHGQGNDEPGHPGHCVDVCCLYFLTFLFCCSCLLADSRSTQLFIRLVSGKDPTCLGGGWLFFVPRVAKDGSIATTRLGTPLPEERAWTLRSFG